MVRHIKREAAEAALVVGIAGVGTSSIMNGQGRFAKQLNGIGCFGLVEVEIELNSSITFILMDTHGEGFHSQGYVEEVPERGYETWKQGAVLGVAYALRVMEAPSCAVTITKIEGLTSDTNPTIVAAAAMDAVWKAFGFTPEPGITEIIEQSILASRSLPFQAVCVVP